MYIYIYMYTCIYINIYIYIHIHICLFMQRIANFTWSDLACPDLDTEEELEAQNFGNRRYR